MNKSILIIATLLPFAGLRAQNQAETYIKEAQEFLAKKEYKQAQMSLQDALNETNRLLGVQVAESLPAEVNGLRAEGDAEVNMAGMGMIGGGLQISKRYNNAAKPGNDADVQIIANSPLIATMSMYLSNPAIMGPEYKGVRVGATRAILKSTTQDGKRSSELQIPLGQTMITIQANGFASEQDELAFAGKLGLDKIKAALGE